jgi:preprotein translocase subunit YajC
MLPALLLVLQEAANQATPANQPANQPARSPGLFDGGGGMLVPMIALIVIFYFLMWRPQAKERKKREEMIKAVKKGDRVLLTCGLVAQIAALTEHDVLVRFDDKDPKRLRFRRYAIQSVLEPEEAPAEPAEAEAK